MTEDFSTALLKDLAIPANDFALAFVAEWIRYEGTTAQYNPLATTLVMPNSTSFNSVGVRNYASFEDGVLATARTLDPVAYNSAWTDYYPAIRAALREGGFGAMRSTVANQLRKWGTVGFADAIDNGWNAPVVAPIPPPPPAPTNPQLDARLSAVEAQLSALNRAVLARFAALNEGVARAANPDVIP